MEENGKYLTCDCNFMEYYFQKPIMTYDFQIVSASQKYTCFLLT